MENVSDIWNEALPSRFARELCAISNEELMRAFLRDVMTERELREVHESVSGSRAVLAVTLRCLIAPIPSRRRLTRGVSYLLVGDAAGFSGG